MEEALQKVREILAASSSPAVFSSFGKDSMLLLWMIRQWKPSTPVLWFRTGHDERFGRRIIREWNLTAFRWPPADVYLLNDDQQRTLVHEYGIGEHRLPLLIDLEGSGPCAANLFPLRTPTLYLPFDTLLVGWKDSDTHWVKGEAPLAEDGFMLGQAQVHAPLRHMTDAAVMAAIIEQRIPYEPIEDELAMCTHCVDTKPLEEFRSRFDLKEIHNGARIRR